MIRREAIADLVTRAHREVDEGLLPSCQLAIAHDGEIVEAVTIGDTPAGDDSRYVMFSCTKAIVVSAIWQLLAEGGLALEDHVAEHIPEFKTNRKDVITVEQLLLHTSGFPSAPLGPPAWDTREGRLEAFGRWRLNWEPGTRFEYHPTSAHWVLAELLARADGVDHRDALRRRVIDPLGLQHLRIGVPEAEQGDIARVVHVGEPPTAAEFEAVLGIPGLELGEVTEEALGSFANPEPVAVGVPGGGGITNASDLALFYQALLHNPGDLWDPQWLARGTAEVRNSYADPMTGAPANRTIGLVVAGDDGPRRGFGHGTGPRTFGHDGAGGQLAWGDPDSGVSFAYLTNGLDRHQIRQWRRNVGINSRAAVAAVAD
jgi:CubicO group peptidase (beta-lactamase class C family)